ncbi:MAG: thioredoxin domain-containing protein [Cytophagales bacterium CG12_big_fil_rev_8_21_14_0_65_40_12]|nr:MAG: thioredoxin domain-containing protein [Cytophagales bacterium CG12_big_fil_rev_8_21_14_0_65_40_12]PIW03851.1 MAG: thioredoxin domain-containing protein [Cytophagales bacterium CG17_big_fil_post_rev_8_21_14_2_50_40_13]
MPKHTNRLIDSSSPYLLQHAHNPVNWFPWDEEALALAKSEDKPIIVSIGYSACHWCHVMERESFENEQIAEIMNKDFICIKVDREERPDVDQIYMDAVHAMGLQGGWPLNVILLPDQRPFYGGTYFPAKGWANLLSQVATVFKKQRSELEKSADGFMNTLNVSDIQKYGLHQGENAFGKEELSQMFEILRKNFDLEKGGMNRAPKFPMPIIYAFLLREASINKNPAALAQVELTLEKMAFGGLYDQIGGGFTRYSTDEDWFAPHFEKMLYDNGQLVSLYSEAYQETKNPLYKATIYQTIEWLEREMTTTEGGFYAALDADSEGEEGKFYCWREDEFHSILGPDADLLIEYYNLTARGNWEPKKNIPFRKVSDEVFAKQHDLELDELQDIIKIANLKLLEARASRIRPGLDDKILSGWNGLMLKGLVDAYATFQETSFLEMAKKNANFILTKMKNGDGLFRNYKDGKASINAYLEDYAAVIQGLTALYQVTFDLQWLTSAEKLLKYTLNNFFDDEEQFFFFTDEKSEKLIARKKEIFDNVIPGSNSMMAQNLYQLGTILGNEIYTDLAQAMLGKVKKMVLIEPQYLTNWACLFSQMVSPTAEIALVGEDIQKQALEFYQSFIPNKVLAGSDGKDESNIPLLEQRTTINGQTTFYVCYNKACQLPVNSVSEALELIEKGN